MATIKAFIRPSAKAKETNIRFRLSVGRGETHYGVSDISINPAWWNAADEEIKPRVLLPGSLSREDINARISSAKTDILRFYSENKDSLDFGWMREILCGKAPAIAPDTEPEADPFFTLFDEYIDEAKVSKGRRAHLLVVREILRRFKAVTGAQLSVTNFACLKAFDSFLHDEMHWSALFPEEYAKVKVLVRGQNTVNSKLRVLKAFFNWVAAKPMAIINPFAKYEMVPDVYGDPLPLLPQELEHLLNFPISAALSSVRDMFVLQCYVGCRVGDFMGLTIGNVDDGLLSYIPEKTIASHARTVYVPLHKVALKLIARIKTDSGRLVPEMSVNGEDGYNKKIKRVCKEAGLNRKVIILNTVTRQPETKELHEVVSSHTARKTFINSNYKETQDPALISQMTGHSPNSKAFARYRDIDLDILRAQIKKTFGE